jgi:hypothetical protein
MAARSVKHPIRENPIQERHCPGCAQRLAKEREDDEEQNEVVGPHDWGEKQSRSDRDGKGASIAIRTAGDQDYSSDRGERKEYKDEMSSARRHAERSHKGEERPTFLLFH